MVRGCDGLRWGPAVSRDLWMRPRPVADPIEGPRRNPEIDGCGPRRQPHGAGVLSGHFSRDPLHLARPDLDLTAILRMPVSRFARASMITCWRQSVEPANGGQRLGRC
jgi:hypothetical protein